MIKHNKPFFGRKEELEHLRRLLTKNSASLIVVRGRRRIGKSRLLEEFGKEMKTCFFSGIPPSKKTTAQGQRDNFAVQMAKQLQMPSVTSNDWAGLFSLLAERTREGKILIVLDEISWLGSKDPDFLGKFKNAWDMQFSQNPSLILALCGSVSTWIEKNILSHTGFLGRISLDLVLLELSLHDSALFWEHRRNHLSSHEIFKVLAVTGGIPKYLEEIVPRFPAEENIRTLCFQPSGLLFREFDQIFSDLFSKRSAQYGQIVQFLSGKAAMLQEICDYLKVQKSGKISRYLHHLNISGFIASDPTWNLSNSKISNLKYFRLKDNYLRFYLKYIQPHKQQIEKGFFPGKTLTQLPDWPTVMGLQFENLVINNMRQLFPLLKLEVGDVSMAGPYFQKPTARQQGCQVDLLIQTRFKTIFVCEVKFHVGEVGIDVVEEVKEKIRRISVPKGTSIRPVLITVNAVSESVRDADFFDFIIDFSQLLS
jgi:AAA+ ATPase superfamily predicted ATPase